MSGRTILYVRHAESVANAGGITLPNNEIPLSEAGKQAALELAEWLPAEPALVLVSKALRTQQTAEPYCRRTGAVPVVEPLLDEFSIICPSLIEGMDGPQRRVVVRPLWEEPAPHRRSGPQADTFMEFQGRVRRFVDERLDELPDGTVVFGHGIWLGLLLWHALGHQADDSAGVKVFRRFQQGLPVPNCAVYGLRFLALSLGPSADTVRQ